MTSRRSAGQRSRSGRDGNKNLVNSITPEPMKRYEPKLTQPFRTDHIFKVMGSNVKVMETFSGEGILIDGSCQLLSSFYYKIYWLTWHYHNKWCRRTAQTLDCVKCLTASIFCYRTLLTVWMKGNIHKMLTDKRVMRTIVYITRNMFCGTWYLPHSQVHNDEAVPIIMARCTEHARNGHISISALKSDVTIVFFDPDFL